MLTKETIIDRIEILSSGAVQVRRAVIVLDDGVELSRSYERWVLNPGDDLTEQDERVRRVAEAAWAD